MSKRTLCLVFIAFILLSKSLAAQTLNGPLDACIEACETYSLTATNPSETYYWTIEGGFPVTAIGTSVDICWTSTVNTNISVSNTGFNTPVNLLEEDLDIQSQPIAEIIDINNYVCVGDSIPGSQTEIPTVPCGKLCPGTSMSFEAIEFGGNSYSWDIDGGNIDASTDNTVDVTWGTPGFAEITLIEFNGSCEEESVLCFEIVELPTLAIQTNPPLNTTNEVDICRGQTVYFSNAGSNAVDYNWFIDGSFLSSSPTTSHTFESAGTFNIKLEGSSSCNCLEEETITVNVSSDPGPPIRCVGSVCPGETVTYYSQSGCSNYNWAHSSEGTLISGGGPNDDYIEIQWINGTLGTITLESSGCTPAVCSEQTIVEIPIINNVAVIEGADIVCKDETSVYSIPEFTGTSYHWELIGQGYISDGQGTNVVQVSWNEYVDEQTATLNVTYDNCFQGCSGSASKEIEVKSRFDIFGDQNICEGNNSYILAATMPGGWDGVLVDWTITAPNGSVITESSTENLSYDFSDGAGSYQVEAVSLVPNDHCNTSARNIFYVAESPETPLSISGVQPICSGETATYFAEGNVVGSIEWAFEQNGSMTNKTGNPISMTWDGSPPFSVSVLQSSLSAPFCNSENLTENIELLSDLEIEGPDQTCVDMLTTYEAKDLEAFGINWSVDPPEAGTTISSGANGSIQVNWHMAGMHQVEADYCGLSRSMTVEVIDISAPTITGPSQVCIGEVANLGTVQSYTDYLWNDETGATVSTLSDPVLGVGNYHLEVTNAAGCKLSTTHSIEEYAAPDVSLTSSDDYWFCPADEPGVTLQASTGSAIATYEWIKDGVVQSGTGDSLFGTEGTYQVNVIDVNGCIDASNEFVVVIDCDPDGGKCNGGGGAPFCPDTEAFFTYDYGSQCTEINFTNTTPNVQVGGYTQWYIANPVDGDTDYFTFDATHTYSKPGFYPVYLFQAVVEPSGMICIAIGREVVDIPVVPDFEFFTACVGEPVEFFDHSALNAGASITAHSWDFDDGTSGMLNTSSSANPTHTFDTPGIYDVSMTVSTAVCTQTVTKQVEIKSPPSLDFAFVDPSCEFSSTAFTPIISADVIGYSWDFDDGTNAANTSSAELAFHTFDSPGNYDVSLEVTDIYGCINTIQHTVEIIANTASPSLTLSGASPICQGETITLSAPAGGISYLWSNGEFGESIEVGVSGSYSVLYSDANGCESQLGPELIEVVPSPYAFGAIDVYNNIGMPAGSAGTSITICENENAALRLPYYPQTTCNWSDGHVGSYYWPTLSLGMNTFSASITDNNSGCESELVDFEIEVVALPASFNIDGPSLACDGEENILTVNSPQPNTTYVWNNGVVGTTTTVYQSGNYFATATNEWGCERRSSSFFVGAAPSVLGMPVGCIESCLPETICLPEQTGVTYQWFQDGVAIAGSEGTVQDLMVSAEGAYHVEMTGSNGCSTISEPVDITNTADGSEITVQLFLDEDGDGVQNGNDSNLPNLPVQLEDSSGTITELISDSDGFCRFEDLIAGTYTIAFDLANWDPCFPDPGMNDIIVTLECGDDEFVSVPFEATESSTVPIFIDAPDYEWECGLTELQLSPTIDYAGSLELTYAWSTGENTSSIVVSQSGTYALTVSNACESVSQNIQVQSSNDQLGFQPIITPTGFTPNGDGLNDVFKPIPSGGVEILDLDFRVYDRWGRLRYAGTDSTQGWEAVNAEVGVFVWIAKGTMSNCGEVTDFSEKGNVTLIR